VHLIAKSYGKNLRVVEDVFYASRLVAQWSWQGFLASAS